MTSLVIAEHDNNELKAGTLSAVTAAQQIGGDVDILVAGGGCSVVADNAAKIAGVNKVVLVDDTAYGHFLAENLALLISSMAEGYSHIIAPAGTFGKDFMPRVAARLDVAQISDIVRVESEDTFVRPIYAGNALATVQSSDKIKVVTVRVSSFDKSDAEGGNAAVENAEGQGDRGLSEFISIQQTESARPDLTAASVVISGGRGMASAENFSMLERIADKLGGAVGASRAAVDAGYVPNDYQVGQTGKIVAPDLYMAVGISGAIQHLAGMKESKVIVAINKDENAPIFDVADYGLVMDLFDALPEIEQALG